jgi:hypothetical protein
MSGGPPEVPIEARFNRTPHPAVSLYQPPHTQTSPCHLPIPTSLTSHMPAGARHVNLNLPSSGTSLPPPAASGAQLALGRLPADNSVPFQSYASQSPHETNASSHPNMSADLLALPGLQRSSSQALVKSTASPVVTPSAAHTASNQTTTLPMVPGSDATQQHQQHSDTYTGTILLQQQQQQQQQQLQQAGGAHQPQQQRPTGDVQQQEQHNLQGTTGLEGRRPKSMTGLGAGPPVQLQGGFTPGQLIMLRSQIMAFRRLKVSRSPVQEAIELAD